MTWFLIASGGAVGAAARFLLDTLASRRLGDRWPWGTLAVNVLGSGLLGVLVGAGAGGSTRSLLAVGFCGAFTTTSAFAWQTIGLWYEGRRAVAVAYVVVSVVAAVPALAAGWVVGAQA